MGSNKLVFGQVSLLDFCRHGNIIFFLPKMCVKDNENKLLLTTPCSESLVMKYFQLFLNWIKTLSRLYQLVTPILTVTPEKIIMVILH